jgi:superfamily II DNA or RNA helicase
LTTRGSKLADKVFIQKINEVYVKVIADPSIKMDLAELFTFDVPGAKFSPAYKMRRWDGKIRLLNVMTGLIYLGLAPDIVDFCKKNHIDCELSDDLSFDLDHYSPEQILEFARELNCKFIPHDYQTEAVCKALSTGRTLLLSPTASGKSLIIYLITRWFTGQGKKVLIVVPTISLVSQMQSDFVDYNMGIELPIHKIKAGEEKNTKKPIVVSTWQSIFKQPKAWFDQFDVVIGDEAHNFKAKSLTGILDKMSTTKYRFGFTGTLDGLETNEKVLRGIFGPIHRVIRTKELIDRKVLSPFAIRAITINYSDELKKNNREKTYQEEIDWIVRNEKRNKFIRNMALGLKGNTLILFQYVEKHGKELFELISKSEDHTVTFIHGGVSGDAREEIRLNVQGTTNNILVASYGVFSTGVNIPQLDNLIFASPSKGKIRNLQSIGRILRKAEGKEKAILYDIVDDLSFKGKENYAMKHFKERVKIYTEEDFDFKTYKVEL